MTLESIEQHVFTQIYFIKKVIVLAAYFFVSTVNSISNFILRLKVAQRSLPSRQYSPKTHLKDALNICLIGAILAFYCRKVMISAQIR